MSIVSWVLDFNESLIMCNWVPWWGLNLWHDMQLNDSSIFQSNTYVWQLKAYITHVATDDHYTSPFKNLDFYHLHSKKISLLGRFTESANNESSQNMSNMSQILCFQLQNLPSHLHKTFSWPKNQSWTCWSFGLTPKVQVCYQIPRAWDIEVSSGVVNKWCTRVWWT